MEYLIYIAVLVVLFFVVRFVYRKYFSKKEEVKDVEQIVKELQVYGYHQPEVEPVKVEPLTPETKQQGEEEYQETTPTTVDKVADDLGVKEVDKAEFVANIQTAIDSLPQEEVKPAKTPLELLALPYFFHSHEFENAHRYTVAGKYVKVEDEEGLKEHPSGYKLVLGYAVVGSEDAYKFSRKAGREIATKHMNDEKRSYVFPVTQEQLALPGKTFNELAKSQVPATAFYPEDRHTIRKDLLDRSNYELANRDTMSVEEVALADKDLNDYLALAEKADYNHLMITVEVQSVPCSCGKTHHYLVDNNVDVMVDEPEVETKEETTVETSKEESFPGCTDCPDTTEESPVTEDKSEGVKESIPDSEVKPSNPEAQI